METTHSTSQISDGFVADQPVILPARSPINQEKLAFSRLGAYTGLFLALRMKHPPTAAHSMRVALACSKWAGWQGLSEEDRSLLEVAALLHDVGKIGIPDRVLQKPARLNGSEAKMMEMTCSMGVEMLAGAGASQQLLACVEQSRWKLADEPLLPSRMMAIVDAFDSMTTEQVFRRAMSQEKAIAELCSHVGTQFDPVLVRQFAEVIATPRSDLDKELAQRWLSKFAIERTPGFDSGTIPVSSGAIQNMLDKVFHQRLLGAMGDAAIYLDAGGQILSWNHAAEKLSGRSAGSIVNCTWSSTLIGLIDADGQPMNDDRCPLRTLIQTRSQVSSRCQMERSDGKRLDIQLNALPVVSESNEFTGVIILIRDASAEANLEKRVETLNAIAATDPLTGVANRTAMDLRLSQLIDEANASGHRTSVIMCDIDFFKRINDIHGHQAGDEALKAFARLLGEGGRGEDLVARYGGEEFVILCDGYDNPGATIRAERIRKLVENTPLPALGGKTMTASFGVTELQKGDNTETVVARADRALMSAKQGGRNRVVQTGIGWDDSVEQLEERRQEPAVAAAEPSSWLSWFRTEQVAEQRDFLSLIPSEIAIEKLKGFIADHRAEIIVTAESNRVSVRIDCQYHEGARRQGERPAVFLLDIKVEPVQLIAERTKSYHQCTRFRVSAKPIRARDRRALVVRGQINQILQSFQSYLGAQLIDAKLSSNIIEPR